MLSPELDLGFLFGEPGFHDDSGDIFGFLDRKPERTPYDKNLSTEDVQSHLIAESRLDHLDSASEEPFIFGEPLNPATHFAWDLPEARFRKKVQMRRESANRLSSNKFASSPPPEQQQAIHTLRVNVAASESNPNSKARLGPKDLKEIGKETKMHPGQGVAPEFMKRSSLGAFGPVVTKVRKKKKSIAGAPSMGRGGANDMFHRRNDAHLQGQEGLAISNEDHDDATRSGPIPMDIVLE